MPLVLFASHTDLLSPVLQVIHRAILLISVQNLPVIRFDRRSPFHHKLIDISERLQLINRFFIHFFRIFKLNVIDMILNPFCHF